MSVIHKLKNALGGRWWLPIIGAVGVLLLLFGGLLGSDQASQTATVGGYEEYRAREEARLTTLLSQVGGMGSVLVAIEFEGGMGQVSLSGKQEQERTPMVRGVAVVCTGGGSDIVKKEATELICALYDISYNHVHISPMG